MPFLRWRDIERLIRGRVLQLGLVVYALGLVILAVESVAPDGPAGTLRPFVDPMLVGMTLVALVAGRTLVERRERRFWDLLALAWACWLLVDAFFFFELPIPFFSASFVTDTLYVLYYLIFALAIDLQPHVAVEPSLKRTRRRIESVAGLMVAFGVIVYFAIVVLPDPLGISLSFVSRDHGYTPLLLVRLSMDLFLLGRLIHAAWATSGRWTTLYGLLASGMLCFAMKDALAVLQSENLIAAGSLGLAYAVFLTLPGFFVVLAARYRHVPTELADGETAPEPEGSEGMFRASPFALYAVVVPGLHFLLYPLGLLEPASRQPREVFALGYVLVLGAIAWFHQSVIIKDSRRASQALHEAEERLFRSQRLESVGRLAGGIAHDFNNYLTVIRGYVELLRYRLRDPAALAEIDYVEDAAKKATHLTRQLLAYGRRQVLRPVALDMNQVVGDTSKLLQTLLGEDVTLELDLDPGTGLARADLGQTEQVLMNLAINGRDAMPGGGVLSVRTRRIDLNPLEAASLEVEPGSYVELSIADTGSGMSEEVRARALEPFYTTKEMGQGTGLGLSTVYGIAAQSGGSISLESAVGHGTTVRVLLPAEEGSLADTPQAPQPTPEPNEATLLVVEDDDQVRGLAVRALTDSGFRVFEAACGPDAIDRFPVREPVDLLITDVMLPEMDGVQLAETLVSQHPGLRVLFMSGYPAETLRERQTELPRTTPLLEKPFTPAELVARVHGLLEERR